MAGKILIIDDEPEVAQQATDLLRKAGYDVDYVESAELGIERIAKDAPQLIISDVVMPGIGGFGFFKEIKANQATKDIPVIIMTARGKMKDTFLAMGANEMLAKPYEDDDLLGLVRKYFPDESTAAEPMAQEETADTGVQQTSPEQEDQEQDPQSALPDSATDASAYGGVLLSGVASSALERITALLSGKKIPVALARDALKVMDTALKLQPKCILLDVITDGIPAPEVVKRIRKCAELKEVSVVLFSHLDKVKLSATEQNLRQVEIQGAKAKAIEAGANAYLGDFDEGTFLSAVDEYIK